MDIKSNRFLSIEQLQDQYLNPGKAPVNNKTKEGMSFQDILTSKSSADAQVKFSKHAANRLEDRNIVLSDNQIEGAIRFSLSIDNTKEDSYEIVYRSSNIKYRNIELHQVVTYVNSEDSYNDAE